MKIGYALNRPSRPNIEDQLNVLNEYGVDEIVQDASPSKKPSKASVANRDRMIAMLSERSGYSVVVASPSCIMSGAKDGLEALVAILGAGSTLYDIKGRCAIRSVEQINDFMDRANAEMKHYSNIVGYKSRAQKSSKQRREQKATAWKLYSINFDHPDFLSNKEIAEKCGTTPQTLNRWFGGRDEFLEKLNKST